MTTPFMDEVIAASNEIDGVFAKTFRLLPRIKAADRNAPVVPDPARQEVVFLARLHVPRAKALITDAYDPRTNQRPGTQSQHPLLRISPFVIRTLALVIQAEDLALDIDQDQRWRVSSARTNTDGLRECVVELV